MKLNFVRHRKMAYFISALIIVIGIFSMFVRGLNAGIDFTGGTLVHLDIGEPFAEDEVREVLAPLDLAGSLVQKTGTGPIAEQEEVIIKTISLVEDERNQLISAMQDRWSGITNESILQIQNVGPTIGNELRSQAFWALLIAFLGMIVYITLRFEFKFAVAALIALLHDALIVLTFFTIFQIEINSAFIAAILTVCGYSINDTIVVFDRIRENLKGKKKINFGDIIDQSLNQTFIRSINTSLTTLVVLLSLYIFGGLTLRPFIVALLVGVFAGTYSSMFIASQVWYSWKQLASARKKTGVTIQ